MRTILRNFVSLFKRFKVATWLNIIGLMVAFAAFIIIVIQVKYEYDFDKCHPTADLVFRIDFPDKDYGNFSVIHVRPLVEAVIQSSPHIEAGTLINPYLSDIYFSVIRDGEKQGVREQVVTCHAGITNVFDFPVIEGDKDCLRDPEKVIIPLSLARKLFPGEPATGKQLHAEEDIWTKDRKDFTIGAVYKDFPDNTQLKNAIYTAIDPDCDIDNWNSSNFIGYLLLKDASLASQVEETFNNSFDYSKLYNSDKRLSLVPFTSIYFRNEGWNDNFKSGSRESTLLFLGIAFLVIIIAAINYTNFSTALTPMRIKSINTQKVLGSPDRLLQLAMVVESVLISLFSCLLAIGLVYILQKTNLFSFTEAGIDISNNLQVVFFAVVIALVCGIVAGLYPAFYSTSFPPALVLKGNFGLSEKGRRMRTLLIGFQFVVSVVLIIASLFIQLQRRLMLDFTSGFDKDQIAIIDLNSTFYANNREALVNNLKSYAGIEDVAFSSQKLGSSDMYSTSNFEYNGYTIQYFLQGISPNFFSVMGIDIVEGREPTPGDMESGNVILIANQQIRDKYSLELGTHDFRFFTGHVIGFSENVNFTSLRNESANYLFSPSYNSPFGMAVSYIRLKSGTDYFAAVKHIRESVAKIDPGFPVEVEFYDKLFEQLYYKEESLNKMITLFSLLAIVISIVGVFGLVLFESQYRRKEIGIRKVMGAEIKDILFMFGRTYLYIVCICFVIAAPLAYYGVTHWLQNFAYKTPLYWWVFVLAFIIVAFITMVTVTLQNWQSARENPVDSIQTE